MPEFKMWVQDGQLYTQGRDGLIEISLLKFISKETLIERVLFHLNLFLEDINQEEKPIGQD